MSDPIPTAPIPTAHVRVRGARRRRVSAIWAVPAVALAIGAWLVWQTLSERGPLVEVSFLTAEGLTAKQSRVRHKEVDVGVVERISLSADRAHVVATLRIDKSLADAVDSNTRFWVVKPRFFAGSVSGLQTILSGAYIELSPSVEHGAPATRFVGLENPPILKADVPGKEVRLKAARIGSLGLGSPIYFRDFAVGEVLGWDVSEMAESVTIHAFVRAPFDAQVHSATRFWNASALGVEVGPQGLRLRLESLRAFLLGGIAFDTPPGSPNDAPAAQYTLYPTQEAADGALYGRGPPLAAIFRGSVAGLAPGSPVKLHGIKIGEVDSVRLEYEADDDSVIAVARFYVEPGRIEQMRLPTDGEWEARMARLVGQGLRVRLETANLLTGIKQLTLDPSGGEGGRVARRGDALVLPSVESAGDPLAGATAVLDKIAAFPLEELGRRLVDTVGSVDAIVRDPEVKGLVAAVRAALATTQGFLQLLNRTAEPALQRLPDIARRLDETLKRADGLIASIDTGYGNNSQLNRDATKLAAQLAEASRSIRVLADLLARHPEALLRGRTNQGP